MKVEVYNTSHEPGKAAGKQGAHLIREAIEINGTANIILATGTSQLETLKQLVSEDIDWSKVVMFHLDEYIELPVTHPASFRKYLQERFISKVSSLKATCLINGTTDPEEECKRLGRLITTHTVDVAFVGIGENGHLAFNDPPADFETNEPYIVVNLDQNCRQQQVGEGWFKSLDEVPTQAISMSIRQILRSRHILCIVPDQRKAVAVKNSIELEVNPLHPASILQKHDSVKLYLDRASASLLRVQ